MATYLTSAKSAERVLWVVHFDPRGNTAAADFDDKYRCKHVNFISNSHIMNDQGQPCEAEYLFAPYSTFTVRSVRWGTGSRRHRPPKTALWSRRRGRGLIRAIFGRNRPK